MVAADNMGRIGTLKNKKGGTVLTDNVVSDLWGIRMTSCILE